MQVPIDEWELLKSKYPDTESINAGLPDWQKEMTDTRLRSIEEDPSRLLPIHNVMVELNKCQNKI